VKLVAIRTKINF